MGSPFARTELKKGFDILDLVEVGTGRGIMLT